MAVPNIFEELDAALKDFRTFLETEETVQEIRSAVQALASFIPALENVIVEIVGILMTVRAEIQDMDLGDIPEVDVPKVLAFVQKLDRALETSRALVPNTVGDRIEDVQEATTFMTSVSQLTEDLKESILQSLEAIICLFDETALPDCP